MAQELFSKVIISCYATTYVTIAVFNKLYTIGHAAAYVRTSCILYGSMDARAAAGEVGIVKQKEVYFFSAQRLSQKPPQVSGNRSELNVHSTSQQAPMLFLRT